ncbi:probable arsenite efflux transporter ArsB-like, puative [Cephalotrichum gorgonifer]|uniref:Probable arsenite efflux transporter ArsB-like, puative n=1 Tax=Cephalotrichum gorgonifer TaxID=2041049 RepID=A0AAE8T0N6_9PEZI|nr:probable arsenite efflux transporter ArsB-like, puative [Cephalotrichum gorgonifer]
MNFVTAPLIADLFLLAISAIGREEVAGGTIGADHISPIDIMVFFITLAYIAISIDASGLIRFLAYKVLLWGGKGGHRLFFYLYTFFALLGSFIGNDPIILSGTPFLAYMTHVSSNIRHPRAWIFTQFAIANIVSAILVSSNPTNLVLAGAFQIKFIDYTVNMIVPVVITAVVLFPLLLYVIFRDDELIPKSITMHELPEEMRAEPPKNPCIPFAKGVVEEEENNHPNDDKGKLLELQEIMHPFLDKKGAIFGSIIMAATLITVLVLNAASPTKEELPVFWVTLPAAVVMLCWDVVTGWLRRAETREISRKGRRELEQLRSQGVVQQDETEAEKRAEEMRLRNEAETEVREKEMELEAGRDGPSAGSSGTENGETSGGMDGDSSGRASKNVEGHASRNVNEEKRSRSEVEQIHNTRPGKTTLVSLVEDGWAWARETCPTATFVLAHLPLALIPFAFTMFVLVQALVTKGWVPVFAYGWDHWVNRTGTVGAIGGMGFVSVIFCNFAGTNIGTTILLCRIIQAWQGIHENNHIPISNRTFWATVYSMALGVNYGAFSAAFSASLAGLLWRDILGRKHIHIRARDFARYNVPIIAASMVVGCAVLIGEVYIMRGTEPYSLAR